MLRRKLFVENDEDTLNSSAGKKATSGRSKIHPALLVPSSPDSGPKQAETPADKNPKEAKMEQTPDIDIEKDWDEDMQEVGFFANSNQKLPYTKEEDELILKYVLKGENIFKVGSLSLWKQLEVKKENPKRTYQSLKNRFLRNIRPNMFTRFYDLVKDKDTTKKILAKFPELKHQIGRKKTLTEIKLPERRPPEPAQNVPEDDGVSSTSSGENQRSVERSAAPDSVSAPQDQTPNTMKKPAEPGSVIKPTPLPSKWHKTEVYQKTVKETDGVISVCVNLKMKKVVNTAPLGIYEKFKRLERKNKLTLCPSCGNYNKPQKISLLSSSRESDVLIPNSLDTSKSKTEGSSRKTQSSRAEKRRKVNSSSEPSKCSPCSPSLLSEVSAVEDINESPQNSVQEKTVAQVAEMSKSAPAVENSRVTQVSDSATAGKDVGPEAEGKEAVESSKVTQIPNSEEGGRTPRSPAAQPSTSNSNSSKTRRNTAKASNSRPNKKREGTTAKRLRESEEDLDSICEEAMANFRRLIDSEQELNLVRKCLTKNSKRFGLKVIPQADWDSYFVESSSEEGTPPLTIDYETDSTTDTTSASLAGNMTRMLRSRNRMS